MSSTDSPQVSRGLLVALGVVAGLGALALLYLYVVQPLLGTDEVALTDPAPAATAPSPAPSPEPGTPPANGEVAQEPMSETFEVFTARDPFQQLVVAQAGGGGDGGGNGDGSTPSPSPTPTDANVGGTTVRLVDVFTDDGVWKVLVTVNGTGYEVAEGETFAERFRVLDISGECATFLFGDSRFTLCQGEVIRK